MIQGAKRGLPWPLAAALAAMALASPAAAADLIVVGVDAKFAGVQGAPTDPRPAPNDSLVVIDASRTPAVKATVGGLDHSIMGPPQTVAITPDGRLALVASPTSWDFATRRETLETYLTVVDLTGRAAPAKVELGAQPLGLAISPDGRLALAAGVDGVLKVLAIKGRAVTLADSIPIAKRLSGVVIAHDGRTALVGVAGEGLAALSIARGKVSLAPGRVAAGIGPYDMDVSAGRWAVVTNLGGPPGADGRPAQDSGFVTLLDLGRTPVKVASQATTPATPEGVAISPDGRWIVAQVMDGSNLPAANPRHKDRGRLQLYANRDGALALVDEVAGGEAGQGVAFARDNRTVLVELNVEKALAVYRIEAGKLIDTGQRLAMPGSPVSIAGMPR